MLDVLSLVDPVWLSSHVTSYSTRAYDQVQLSLNGTLMQHYPWEHEA